MGRLLGLLGPVALLAAGGNLLLVRRGRTVLAGAGGRPLTLESALYGLAAACLLGGGGALVCQLAGGAHGG